MHEQLGSIDELPPLGENLVHPFLLFHTFQSVNMDTVAIQEGGERGEMEEEEEEEEDPGITDIDEPTPRFTKPISTLPGTFICACACM